MKIINERAIKDINDFDFQWKIGTKINIKLFIFENITHFPLSLISSKFNIPQMGGFWGLKFQVKVYDPMLNEE